MTIDYHSTNIIRFIKDNIILNNVKGMDYDKISKLWNSYFAYGTKHSNIVRIWMNEEMKQDYYKTQLNSNQPVSS